MVKIENLDQALKDFSGVEIKNGGVLLTIKEVLVNHLGTMTISLAGSGEKVVKSYKLGKKLYDAEKGKELTIPKEDIQFIKDTILHSPVYTSLVLGQVVEFLEKTLKK